MRSTAKTTNWNTQREARTIAELVHVTETGRALTQEEWARLRLMLLALDDAGYLKRPRSRVKYREAARKLVQSGARGCHRCGGAGRRGGCPVCSKRCNVVSLAVRP